MSNSDYDRGFAAGKAYERGKMYAHAYVAEPDQSKTQDKLRKLESKTELLFDTTEHQDRAIRDCQDNIAALGQKTVPVQIKVWGETKLAYPGDIVTIKIDPRLVD